MHNVKRYLLVFISLMIFFGCKNEVKSDFEETKNTGAYIKIQKVQSRSILPYFYFEDMTDFVFTGTKEGEQPIVLRTYENYFQLNGSSFEIQSGNWTFTLQANISSSKYESTITKTIVEGENLLNFVMELQEKGNSNDSSINVLLSFEQNPQVNKVKAALYDIGMQNQIAGYEEELLQITNNYVCYNKTNVPSGEYILKVDFYGSDDIYLGTYKELVVTVSGCESNEIRDITLENFYTIEYQLNGGNWVTGFTAPVCYNRFSDDIELPIPTREGFLFLGWYADEEFTNKITTIESNRNENVSVFAKWSFAVDISNADSFDVAVLKDGDTILIKGIYSSTNMEVLVEKVKSSNVQFSIDLSGLNGFDCIGDYAFKDCSGLTSITIPDGVTSIGNYAFRNCSGLTSITIPDSVRSIGSCAFCNCTGLTSIIIPNSVNIIESEAFYGCSGLTSVTILDGVVDIGYGAFGECSGLTSIIIPKNVTSIPDSAFYNCSGLTSITISDNVKSIGYAAFGGCSELKEVHINNLESWLKIVFESEDSNPVYKAKNGLYINGNRLKGDIVIPNSVTSINFGAFYGCSELTSIKIPSSVTRIGDYAFYGCSGLTSIEIPSSVTSIGAYAFSKCSGLTSLEFFHPYWYYVTNYYDWVYEKIGTEIVLSHPEKNATKFKEYGFDKYYFFRQQ